MAKALVRDLKEEFDEIFEGCTITFGITDNAMGVVFGEEKPEPWKKECNFNLFRYNEEDIMKEKVVSKLRNAPWKATPLGVVLAQNYKWNEDGDKVTIEVLNHNPFTGNDTLYFGISTFEDR